MATTRQLLLVDDAPDWRNILSRLLAMYDYRVTAAGTQEEALLAFQGSDFDAAILDMRLDETDEGNTEGLALARVIRHASASLPIIMLTGYASADSARIAMQPDASLGRQLADRFMEKDQVSELPEVIEELLRRRVEP